MSKLTDQTLPVVTRISLLIKTIQPDQSNPEWYARKRLFFSAKTLEKSRFHFQTDWSGNGPAGQFWQMESVLRSVDEFLDDSERLGRQKKEAACCRRNPILQQGNWVELTFAKTSETNTRNKGKQNWPIADLRIPCNNPRKQLRGTLRLQSRF